ncbi:MAG TPA: hypothetical protein VFT65_00330, partial [Candidatus Angelobacter sp.]|nr:hypothetical protein [Candidatus Angelobacter sp.]
MGTRLASFTEAGKIATFITLIAAAVLISGCSKGQNVVGGSTPTPTPTPTPAAARMLVSDNSSGTINVVNAQTDVVTHTIAVPSPGKMVSAGGTTLIQSTIASTLTIFDNATEAIRFSMTLPAQPVDIAITPDGQTGWVAENNGTVQSISTATGTVSATFTVAGVQRLAIGPQGTTILAFNDTLANNFTVIVPGGSAPIGNIGLDHPTNAFFLGDDNHFTVADCGAECAGTQANVADVSLNNIGGPAVSAPLSLSGATEVLATSAEEFVAGSPATGLNAGTLQVVSRATFTAGTPFNIADGRHDQIALTSNGRLYVGST